MKKRGKLIRLNNMDFESSRPWKKGFVFGGVIGIINLIVVIIMLNYFNSIEDMWDWIFFLPFISMFFGLILGILFFRKYK